MHTCIPRVTVLQAHLYSKDYAVAGTPVFQGLVYGMHTCTQRVTVLQAHLHFKDYDVAGTPIFQGLRCCMHTCIPRTTLLQTHLYFQGLRCCRHTYIPRTTLLQSHLYSKDYSVESTPAFQGLRCCRHTCISRVGLWNVHLYPTGCVIPCILVCPSRLPASTPRTRLPYKCLACTIHISNVSFTNNSVLCSQHKQCCSNSRTCHELWARVLLGLLHTDAVASNKM